MGQILMKTALALFLTLAPTTAALAQSPARQACNAVVDVTDTDPKGTNVRSEPGGSVLATLKKSTDNG
jgi:hypothetical protein